MIETILDFYRYFNEIILSNPLSTIGLLLIVSFLGSKIFQRFGIPQVVGFIVLGVLHGPSFLNVIPLEVSQELLFISEIALGLIGFDMGSHLKLGEIRKLGKSIIFILIFEAFGAFFLVTAGVYALTQSLYTALIFGAISSATAPAATVLVIREYRASGMLTEILLKVVAIDDAWCLILGAMAIAFANAMRADVFQASSVFAGIGEIFGALIIGGFMGYAFSSLNRFVKTSEEFLIYIFGFILFNVGLSITVHVSVLLSSMMMGLVVINISRQNYKFFEVLRTVDAPLYLVFFILAGAHLDFSILYKMGVVGILYIVFRTIGKVYGAKIGAHISKAPRLVESWIGLALSPQAGVALGIGLVAKATFPDYGDYIFTVIAATTVVFELVGPLLTKLSLQRAGEISSFE